MNDNTWLIGVYVGSVTSMLRWLTTQYFFTANGEYLRTTFKTIAWTQAIRSAQDRTWPGMGDVFGRHRRRAMP